MMLEVGSRVYQTVVDMNASTAVVWKILHDVTEWPSWTPTVTSVRPRGGTRLDDGAMFDVKQPGVPTATYVVKSCIEGESFLWEARAAGLRNSADHSLEKLGTGGCRLTLTFTMEGRGAAVAWMFNGRKIREFVNLEARSLKFAAESGASRWDSQ
jgi:hypothetical protein